MRHSPTYIRPSRCSLRVMAFCVALSLVFCGAANGLAKTVRQATIIKRLDATHQYQEHAWYLVQPGVPDPTVYDLFPFLLNLKREDTLTSTVFYPFGYTSGSAPYVYVWTSQFRDITVPDSFTPEDIAYINEDYLKLSTPEKQAVNGLTAGQSVNGDETVKFWMFTHSPSGTLVNNSGVSTLNADGIPIVSYPDNTGYASGYEEQPDGSYSPVYYKIDNGNITKVDNVTANTYDTLSYDSDSGRYSLNVPDYSPALNKIINELDSINNKKKFKIDNIELEIPDVNVSVEPSPQLSDISSNLNDIVDSVSQETVPQLSNISSNLQDLAESLSQDPDPPFLVSTNDLELTQEELDAVDSLRRWETNIPLIGTSLDFGLTTLLGRIPAIGTEYVWMDYTVGTRSTPNLLQGLRIYISLENYRSVILALRGYLILFEALLFLVMTYRNIREALKV